MARPIVLRYDTTCFDCGRTLSAGTSARWFGKGRVSCCGGATAGASPAAVPAPIVHRRCNVCDMRHDPDEKCDPRGPFGARAPVQPVTPVTPPTAALRPSPFSRALETLAEQTGVPPEALAAGMTQAHARLIAEKAPNTLLLARLTSGARVIVRAADAAHVLRCIEESLVDRVRDVSRWAGAE